MTKQTPSKPTKTKTGWKRQAVHEDITLPSGQQVDIKLPNLSQLLKSGTIPNDLVDAAIQFAQQQTINREVLEEGWDFLVWIIPHTVVNPAVTEEDVAELPSEDLDLLAAFIGRTTDVDAVGKHLGGLDTNADWRRFRGVIDFDEVAARAT